MTSLDTVDNQAELVIAAGPFDETLSFFTSIGFRLESIQPADAPALAEVSGYGIKLILDATANSGQVQINLTDSDREQNLFLLAPNGTRVGFNLIQEASERPALEPEFLIQSSDESHWSVGRAGMQYRDLIPGRQGGYLIGSHIRIPEAGPVPDLVHHHDIDFQMIYCHRGWVRVVYEDQGEPFVLESGDCVLQPPHIRHRVLESSAGLEVIELGSPASHITAFDHETHLPTGRLKPDRLHGGQKFVHFRRENASWIDSDLTGFVTADTGISDATHQQADVSVHRCEQSFETRPISSEGLTVLFILGGNCLLRTTRFGSHAIKSSDTAVLPPKTDYCLSAEHGPVEVLRVVLYASE